MYTNDQDRFDTCEEAVNAVVKKVKRVWHAWKVSNSLLVPIFFAIMMTTAPSGCSST